MKVGQEIDGRTLDSITMDSSTRDMVFWFDTDKIVVRHNESIDKVLNHKWETQDAG